MQINTSRGLAVHGTKEVNEKVIVARLKTKPTFINNLRDPHKPNQVIQTEPFGIGQKWAKQNLKDSKSMDVGWDKNIHRIESNLTRPSRAIPTRDKSNHTEQETNWTNQAN